MKLVNAFKIWWEACPGFCDLTNFAMLRFQDRQVALAFRIIRKSSNGGRGARWQNSATSAAPSPIDLRYATVNRGDPPAVISKLDLSFHCLAVTQPFFKINLI